MKPFTVEGTFKNEELGLDSRTILRFHVDENSRLWMRAFRWCDERCEFVGRPHIEELPDDVRGEVLEVLERHGWGAEEAS